MIFIKGSIIYIPVGQNTILCTLHQKKTQTKTELERGKTTSKTSHYQKSDVK